MPDRRIALAGAMLAANEARMRKTSANLHILVMHADDWIRFMTLLVRSALAIGSELRLRFRGRKERSYFKCGVFVRHRVSCGRLN